MEKSPKGYIRREMESKLNKLGKAHKWEESEYTGSEYWTEEAVKPRKLEEQYPKGEEESEGDYRERLKEIGEYAMLDAADIDMPLDLNKIYTYSESDKEGRPASVDADDKVRGYKFEKYNPDTTKKAAAYNEVFAEQMAKQGIKDAVEDEIKARNEGKLIVKAKMPRAYEEQKAIARYYVGALDYRENTDYQGKFQNAGAGRYTAEDGAWVKKEKAKFLKKDQKSEEVEYLINGKLFEGFFYPLVRYGFFDSASGAPAGIVLSSDYDDFENKVDIAVAVPVESDEENVADYQPIGFDLTTGYGYGKVDKIRNNFIDKCGLTEIKYPSTCFKKEVATLNDVPHFALCLPPVEFREFRADLAGGKLPTQDIRDLINFQIYMQANHWATYWGKQGNSAKTQKFAKIAADFWERLDINNRGGAELLFNIQEKHPEATRYLYELDLV